MKTCDCLAYVRLNLEVLARNRGIMLLTALLALVFCIPVFLSVPTGADYLYGRGSIKEQRALGSVEKVGVEPDPKRVGPASWNLEYG